MCSTFLIVFLKAKEIPMGRYGIISATILLWAFGHHSFSSWQKHIPSFVKACHSLRSLNPSPVTAVKCHWLAIIYHIAYFGQNYSFKGLDSKCKQSIERQHFLKFGDKMLCYFGVGKSICTSLFPMNVEQR